jgi:hypothetical protein
MSIEIDFASRIYSNLKRYVVFDFKRDFYTQINCSTHFT